MRSFLDQLVYANVKSKLGEQVIFTVSECDENEDSVSNVRDSKSHGIVQSVDSSREIRLKSKLHNPASNNMSNGD